MNRFVTRETKYEHRKRRPYLLYIILPAILIGFGFMLSSVDKSTVDRERESLQKAIYRDMIHCYATEGYYPPSLEYIKAHYGLYYDENTFVVDYQPVGNNIRPEITIITVE